jgi:phage shock protein PspC (stress-responsive transcriptional regulator)
MEDMTQTPGPTAGPTTSASGLDRFFDWLRALDLRRDTEDKWLAGVCSGIANRLGVDPIVIRAALVVLVILGGVGITVYLVAWGFIANDRDELVVERALRDGDVWGIILLVVIGLSLVGGTGLAGDGPGFVWFWWLLVPVGVIFWFVTRHRDTERVRAAANQAAQWTSDAGQRVAAASADLGQRAGQWGRSSATAPAATPTNPSGQEPTMTYAAPPAQAAPTTGPAVAGVPPQAPVPPVPVAPKPPRAPRPPRPPRRKTAGFVGAVLVSGIALAAYGLTVWMHDNGNWAGHDETVALAVALGVFGVALVGLGVAGFRAGFTGFIAVVLALTTWTASVVPNLTFGGGIGDRTWRPAATDTTPSYRLGIGSAELDLSDVGTDPTTARQIEAGVGIGELRIRIPADLTVKVNSEVGAGDISQTDPVPPRFPGSPSDDDLFNSTTNGRGGRAISTTETFGTGEPDVVVDAHVGLGQIIIGKE